MTDKKINIFEEISLRSMKMFMITVYGKLMIVYAKIKQMKNDLLSFVTIAAIIAISLIDFSNSFWEMKSNLCKINDNCINNANIYRDISMDFLAILLEISFILCICEIN